MVHFIRRRPDTIWLWIIIFLGPLGALVYIGMEVVPDLALLRQSFDSYGRRKRIGHLEAMVLQNPSAGNYEELGDLYLEEGKYSAHASATRNRSPRVSTARTRSTAAASPLSIWEISPRLSATSSRSRRAIRSMPFIAPLRCWRTLTPITGNPSALKHSSRTPPRSRRFLRRIELRRFSRGDQPSCRSAGVGGARAGEEADNAALPAAT